MRSDRTAHESNNDSSRKSKDESSGRINRIARNESSGIARKVVLSVRMRVVVSPKGQNRSK